MCTRLRDDAIRNAWLEIQADPPWSIKKFLNELSGYDDDSLFELIELVDSKFEEFDEADSDTEIEDSDIVDEDVDFEDFHYDSSDETESSIVDKVSFLVNFKFLFR
ncbi:hypothetical protein TSAR_006876 [Trichomalopsis sarcophagae]|uniref:Uncharacterized protein n=1 Tax=Trichomalopsis sarcophagae TaxID=543379 RepID=A0A232EFE3_9HYME|nr:hypothetical protein TSAR_006876 [Trichomalopsis sarcophagae]